MIRTWALAKSIKRGKLDKGNVIHRHAVRYSRGKEGPGQKVEDGKEGKHRDERLMSAGGGDVLVDVRSAPRRVG